MPEYEIKGKARWLLENEPQLVAFPKESWEYIKEKFNPGHEYDNKGQESGYLMFPDFIALELYKEVKTTKKKLPRKKPTQILCHRCHQPVKKGRWVAPMTVMCFPCIKIMRKEDEAYWKEQERKAKEAKQ